MAELLLGWLAGLLAPALAAAAQAVPSGPPAALPGITWCTVLGGLGEEDGYALALVPGSQDVILASTTLSADFPATPGAFDTSFNGGLDDGFVARFSADGSQLLWATFLGGSHSDSARGVAVLPSGEVIVGGLTQSDDFPTTPGAFNTTTAGGGFVLRLDASGSQLL